MLAYADLASHYGEENPRSLLKYMAFPLILNLPRITGLSFNTIYACFWIFAGISMFFLVSHCSNRWFGLFACLFVMFAPQGFETDTGVQIYRNLLIAPIFYIFFASIIQIILRSWEKWNLKTAGAAIVNILILSVFYPLAYFLKEDSFWMSPVMIVFAGSCLLGVLYHWWKLFRTRKKKKTGLRAARLLLYSLVLLFFLQLPSASFNKVSTGLLDANEKAFGYREYTLRTNGELAGFINRVYKIQSDDRNIRLWAPYDAIQKAFEASPTLSSVPGMWEAVRYSPWTGNGESEIYGDFLSWVMVTALYSQIGNAAQANDFLQTVNRELDNAFESGQLKKDSKIQISASGGGRTWNEVFQIFPDLISFYADTLTLSSYSSAPQVPLESSEELTPYENILNQRLTMPADEDERQEVYRKAETGSKIAAAVFSVYRILLPVMFLLGISIWLLTLVSLFFRKGKIGIRSRVILAIVFALVGLSAGYITGIAWFSQFLYFGMDYTSMMNALRSYGTGSTAMFYSGILLALCLFRPYFLKLKKLKSSESAALKSSRTV